MFLYVFGVPENQMMCKTIINLTLLTYLCFSKLIKPHLNYIMEALALYNVGLVFTVKITVSTPKYATATSSM